MAKKDKVDETPIEFYIPGPGGRGSKVPIPINQPNWKYKTTPKGKPDIFEWIAIGFIVIAVTATILALSTKIESSPLNWIIIIALSAFLVYVIYTTIKRVIIYSETEDNENDELPQKRKKKFPKHRKDYK